MAMILDAFVGNCVETLATMAKNEVALLLGVEDEIEMLQQRLERMLSVVADAERRRFQEEAIKCWAKQLKRVMYDAEDIIEECKLEGERLKRSKLESSISTSTAYSAGAPPRCSYKGFSCFRTYGFRHDIAGRIMTLNNQLDRIIHDMHVLNLIPTPRDHLNNQRSSRSTTHLVEPDLVGEIIEDDTNHLVNLFLSRVHQNQHQEVSVFAIVGMGGIGKTTLAQKIYNDEKLQAGFTIPPIWVCVSQDFSEINLLKLIISRAGGNPGAHKDKEDLEPMLVGIIKEKKFFLVLDDVWDAESVWVRLLRKPLRSCLAGGVILVTTRQQAVAKDMGAVHCHKVQKLSDDSGWLLLSKMVFPNDGEGEAMKKSLKDIGVKIVRKCDGLPLAIRAIAGVLRRKDKRPSAWGKLLENPAWSFLELPDGLRGALYLSYEDLPPHLKQCFIYLGLFPEDTNLWQYICTRFWIAEGFVEAKENSTVEELADEYWLELLERNLLQRFDNSFFTGECKLHDLFHSLAKYLAKDECSIMGSNEISTSSTLSTNRSIVRLVDSRAKSVSHVVQGHAYLRTLHLQGIENFTKGAVKKLRYVRILEIPELHCEKLPNSIGNFLFLRYLNLKSSTIRELPESIGRLQNLQILILRHCKNIKELPNSIANLHNLRDLELNPSLLGVPIGLKRLQNLITFYGWRLSDTVNDVKGQEQSKYCTLEVLSSFSQLRNFSVWNLGVASVKDARDANLEAKSHLVNLLLGCIKHLAQSPSSYSVQEIERIQMVYEELHPPSSIEWLSIVDYYGLEFPSWIMVSPSVFPNLRWLILDKCINIQQLPPLYSLPQLESLRILGASSITSIGTELFLANSGSSFPKLIRFIIQDMVSWEEWSWLRDEEDRMTVLLPCLERLDIVNCPILRSIPEGLFHRATALTSIFIHDANNLTEVKDLLYVKELSLQRNLRLARVSNLPALKKLAIVDCKNLMSVERIDSLQSLVLKDSEMKSLPGWLLGARESDLEFGALPKLYIEGNPNLLMRCLKNGLDWHKIEHISQVSAYTPKRSHYISFTKSPFTFNTNIPQ